MNLLCTETRGICSWRERLVKPDSQWRRGYSAFETAVAWEGASSNPAGLPEPIGALFRNSVFGEGALLLAIAEHKVPLPGGQADSQCDVWALLDTTAGLLSLSVEAKANEPFGADNESLEHWLDAGKSDKSKSNRAARWRYISENLPLVDFDHYKDVPYQLLHRCAAGVIEAKRFRAPNAALVVQAFAAPGESFQMFSRLCSAVGVNAVRGQMQIVNAGDIRLGIGWADCPFATDTEVASVA
jgi:hypothetical protein